MEAKYVTVTASANIDNMITFISIKWLQFSDISYFKEQKNFLQRLEIIKLL